MAHTISEWLLPLFSWAHLSPEPTAQVNSGPEKLREKRTGIESHKRQPRDLSTEEEIIIQMGREYPTLFIT